MLRQIETIIRAYPGFKFSPTEEELILFYMKKKVQGLDQRVEVIAEIDITRYEPWDLPGKAVIRSNNEWFFFSVHGKKYPRGSQSKRATESGYWKVTGNKRTVKSGSRVIGIKRILHFHKGRAPTAQKTEWLMDEYYMTEITEDQLVICRLRRNSELNFDDSSEVDLSPMMIVDTSTSLDVDLQHTGSFEGQTYDNAIDNGVPDGFTSADGCHNPFPVNSENYYQLIQDESSSSPKFQEWHDADDCFRDIINDDILEWQRYSLSSSSHPPPNDILYDDIMGVNITKPSYNIMPSTAPPSQGTANRRIKLILPEQQSNGHATYSTVVHGYGPVIVFVILTFFVWLYCFWSSGTQFSLAKDLSSWFKTVTTKQLKYRL